MSNQVFGPYSPIKQAGNLYFVSGQIGFDRQTETIPQSFDDQTKQAFNNLENVLKSANLKISDVVKTTIFLVDISDYDQLNLLYAEFFAETKPARSTMAVTALPNIRKGIKTLIEIEAVATK